ncbi:uncharacterized protein TRIADDRAFT_61157 [Trichoplax adhaerens]|uniref:Uncharacterized protein n=1 Tax=Trichoplax adhaerens TaxID=10228 RepID=B3SA72_TRIAD|nr:predicted protein [Trichoplax adhaerens]EDV20387.1 predicted protein [Trichoplax adhaerens]|eukprot:XP_002117081.1 predicted protein [Trichoplax adhaerens]
MCNDSYSYCKMRSYYAFTIISFIFSLVQFGLALGFMFGGYYYPIWSNIVSSVLAIFGFSFTMACMILLSQGVFCTPSSTRLPTYTPYTYGSITNNQQIVAPHIPQSNNQPAMTANMNPGLGSQQPTIFQSLDGRQFYVAVPANAVIQPQVAASTNAIVQPQPPNYQVTNSSQNSKA